MDINNHIIQPSRNPHTGNEIEHHAFPEILGTRLRPT